MFACHFELFVPHRLRWLILPYIGSVSESLICIRWSIILISFFWNLIESLISLILWNMTNCSSVCLWHIRMDISLLIITGLLFYLFRLYWYGILSYRLFRCWKFKNLVLSEDFTLAQCAFILLIEWKHWRTDCLGKFHDHVISIVLILLFILWRSKANNTLLLLWG